jgi:predicted metalloprotease
MLTTFQGEVGFPFPAFAFSTHLEVLRTTASNAQTVEQEADCRSGVWSESVEFAMLL